MLEADESEILNSGGAIATAMHKRREDHAPAARPAKKRKKHALKADAEDCLEDLDEKLGINHTVARMDPALTADFIARQTKRFEVDLSPVELEDRRIPELAFALTSGWNGNRTLENLPAFLENQCGRSQDELIRSTSQTAGSPHTIMVTGAALRAAELVRALRRFQTKEVTVAKAFAKHIKLKDAIQFTRKTRMNIAVGTPQRLLDLINDSALSLESLSRVIVDASHINQKRQGILDMRETVGPLTRLLSLRKLRQKYDAGQVKVVMF